MFWKVIEIIVRVVFWRRFRTARKIGEAAMLLSDGKPEAAMAHLEKHGGAVHQSLLPLFALTQGKIHEALGNLEAAENSFKAVVLTDPRKARADVELAVLTGRQFRFDECRIWLGRAIEKQDTEMTERATQILTLLDDIENGSKQTEYEERADAFARRCLIDEKYPGMPPDLGLLAKWLKHPDATDTIDDVALLLARAEVHKGGKWKIGLAIEDTLVIQSDGSEYHPFETLKPWLPATPGSK